MKKVLSIVLVLAILLVGGGGLLASSANASTPADPLYPVDLFAEKIQRAFTFDLLAASELEQNILEERAEELESLMIEEVDEEILGEAVDQLDQQRVRTETKILKLYNEENNYDAEKMELVRNRYELVVQTQVQKMEQVENQYESLGGEAKKGFEESVEILNTLETDKSGAGNQENDDDDTGDGINNRESNSDEDTGNEPSGTADQTGRN